MNRNFRTSLAAFVILMSGGIAQAQDTTAPETDAETETMDEIIVQGKRAWEGHDGMDAFWAGDFETAEIEFEQEFKALRRAESAQYNAAVAADIGFDRAQATGEASVGGLGAGGPGGGPPPSAAFTPTPDLGVDGRFSSRRAKGRNLLNDGKVTDLDFAFTKYMSGLSELQLGKYDEAKASFKSSVHYDGSNHDARMRLGLLYIVERNYDKAADQLQALEKLRQKCKKKNCENYDEILESASTLANSLTNSIHSQ